MAVTTYETGYAHYKEVAARNSASSEISMVVVDEIHSLGDHVSGWGV